MTGYVRHLTPETDQVSGQIINLPFNISRKLDFEKKVSLKHEDLVYNIPPACFITSGSNVKVVLPPGTLPDAVVKGGPSNPIYFTTGRQGTNSITMRTMFTDNDDDGEADSSNVISVTQANQSRAAQKRAANQNRARAQAIARGSIESLHVGFDCMSAIFQHLKLIDVMRYVVDVRLNVTVSCMASFFNLYLMFFELVYIIY